MEKKKPADTGREQCFAGVCVFITKGQTADPRIPAFHLKPKTITLNPEHRGQKRSLESELAKFKSLEASGVPRRMPVLLNVLQRTRLGFRD
jgi:hypothetical protein